MEDLSTIQGVNTPTSFEEPLKEFWKQCHVPITKNSEPSTTLLAVFDAVVTETKTFLKVFCATRAMVKGILKRKDI